MTRFYHSSSVSGRIPSVLHINLKHLRLAVFALAVLVFTSCEKDATKIGYGLLPPTDFVSVHSFDTLSLKSYSNYDRTVRTDNPSLVYLGKIVDPYFGSTTAEFISEVRLRPEWDHVPFTIDSVKLFMKFMTVTGGGKIPHHLKISEVTEQLFTDTAYYSNRGVQADTLNAIDVEIPALVPDSANYIVKTLPVTFGQKLVGDTALLFYSNTIPDYRTSVKGFYFQLLAGTDPLLVSFYADAPSSSSTYHPAYQNFFSVYFHHNADTVAREMRFIIDANNRNAAFSRIINNFNDGADPVKKIQHLNDNYTDTLTYVQYLNGVYTKIELPGLADIKNDTALDNIAINKARLTIPVYFDGVNYKPSTAPSQLIMRYMTSDSTQYYVPDYGLDTYNTYFDGKLDSINNVYHFNISGFVQKYLDDTGNDILPEVEIFQGFTGTKRLIFKGNESKTPLKFEVVYTKF